MRSLVTQENLRADGRCLHIPGLLCTSACLRFPAGISALCYFDREGCRHAIFYFCPVASGQSIIQHICEQAGGAALCSLSCLGLRLALTLTGRCFDMTDTASVRARGVIALSFALHDMLLIVGRQQR